MKDIKKNVGLFLLIFTSFACQTWQSGSDKKEPPADVHKLSFNDALKAGLDFGNPTLKQVKKRFDENKEWDKVAGILYSDIKNKCEDWEPNHLANGINLYVNSNDSRAPELFASLVRQERSVCQQLGWYVASSMPSKKMGQEVEKRLSQAIEGNNLTDILWPKVADAILSNQLLDSYTVLREGLMRTNSVQFAKAMAALDPGRASWDFVSYLSRASVEELRQLTVQSVDMFTCVEIFQHLNAYPPSVTHPEFYNLFFYSISRNSALSEMARTLLVSYMPARQEHLAYLLAQLPDWVQMAFIEGSKRNLTPVLSLFLTELKRNSAQKDVILEIDGILR